MNVKVYMPERCAWLFLSCFFWTGCVWESYPELQQASLSDERMMDVMDAGLLEDLDVLEEDGMSGEDADSMEDLDAGEVDGEVDVDLGEPAPSLSPCVQQVLSEAQAEPASYLEELRAEVVAPGRVVATEIVEEQYTGRFDSGATSAESFSVDEPGAFYFLIEIEDAKPHHYFGLNEPSLSVSRWDYSLKYTLTDTITTPSLARGSEVIFDGVEVGDLLKLEVREKDVIAALLDVDAESDTCAWRTGYRFDEPTVAGVRYRASLRFSNFYARQRAEPDDITNEEPVIEGSPFVSTTIYYACTAASCSN